jgi:diguanylate cyclase (GGDEF)-like protein
MTKKTRISLIYLLAAFIVALIILAYQFHAYTEKYAIQETEKLVQDSLLTHRAIHKYVTRVSRPEIYRLKEEGKLYDEYFSPKTMSFTYTARGIKELLNKERMAAGLPEIYFKLASNNPRNKINSADEHESLLLKKMNAGEITEFRKVVEDPDGNKTLYIAMATDPIESGCLKCHGDPKDAPTEMVALYPKAKGYFEKVGDIRALISIRVPLAKHLEDGQQVANILTLVTFGVLVIIYTIIWFFMQRSDQQSQIILTKNQELEKISTTDYLTNILNRLGFMRLAEQGFSVAKRYDKPFSLIMFDLDRFKEINDSHGHEIGDQVLKTLTALVLQRVRSSDIFGRVGGEEFLVAALEQDQKDALALAEELREIIAGAEFPHQLKISASFGVIQYSNENTLSELISRADQALYQSKNGGRNQVTLFRPH